MDDESMEFDEYPPTVVFEDGHPQIRLHAEMPGPERWFYADHLLVKSVPFGKKLVAVQERPNGDVAAQLVLGEMQY